MNTLHRRTAAARALTALGLGLAALASQAFELRGFRGVEWGEGAQALGVAAEVLRDGDVRCYQRERENMLFGDAALKGVRYCFVNDRFFMVTLDVAVDSASLREQFQRTYGPPDARRGQAARWGGTDSPTRAELAAQGEQARLTLYSNTVATAPRYPQAARRVTAATRY